MADLVSSLRRVDFWQLVIIGTGWTIFALIAGFVLLAAFGAVAPAEGAGSLWLVPVKAAIWPVAGHVLAGWLGRRRGDASA